MKLPLLPLALAAGFLGGHLFIGLGGCRREPAAAPAPSPALDSKLQEILTNSKAIEARAFDIGMCTGYLFAQRGGNPAQFFAARQLATTNREAVVFGTLSGTLLPPVLVSASNAPPEPALQPIDPLTLQPEDQ